MAKLFPNCYPALALLLVLTVHVRIAVSDESSLSSYYSSNYGGSSSTNYVDASPAGDQSFASASEENQYYTPPSWGGNGDSPSTYYDSRDASPPYSGAGDSSNADDVAYASPPDVSFAPSSESYPINFEEQYKVELSSKTTSYDDSSSSTPQSDLSSSSSYDESSSSSTPNDSSTSTSYDDSSSTSSPNDSSSSSSTDDSSSSSSSNDSSSSSSTEDSSSSSSSYDSSSPTDDSSSSSSSYDSSSSSSTGDSSSSSSTDDSSSSSSTWGEDSPPTTAAKSQSSTGETYNSVEAVGTGVAAPGTSSTEHSGSKAGSIFMLLIGVGAVGAVGFIYIKKKRESYMNSNRYISLTRWERT